jgi:hypothetical protein
MRPFHPRASQLVQTCRSGEFERSSIGSRSGLRALGNGFGSFKAIAATLVLTFVACFESQGQLVTYFNFNDAASGSDPVLNPGLVSDAPGQQTSTITTNFATGDVASATGSPVNKADGDLTPEPGRALFLSSTGTNNGAFIEFSFSTIGLQDLTLSYATRGTTDGFTTQTLAYSIGGGAFVDFGTVTPVPTTATYALQSFSLATEDTLENQPSITFRFTFTGGTGGGTNRLDNIQVQAVPEPSTVFGGLAILGLAAYRERRRLRQVLL